MLGFFLTFIISKHGGCRPFLSNVRFVRVFRSLGANKIKNRVFNHLVDFVSSNQGIAVYWGKYPLLISERGK